MSSVSKQFWYEPQQDLIEFTAPDFVFVKYGVITTDESANTTESRWLHGVFAELKQLAPAGHLKVLMDFRTIDAGEFNSHESNKIYRAILQDPALDKVAIFGLPHGWQLLIDFLRVFVPHKLKTFATEEAARAWLYAVD